MKNLRFSDVIEFYRENNDAVYRDLRTAYLSGRMTPFVGAGLSVFCGYKLWPDVLTELSGFIPDAEPKQAAREMIRENRYLEAAEHIHRHYRPMLRRLLGIVSHSRIDSCPDERLYGSAAWVLPRLFGDVPLMTTNFDGVLEHVFAKQNRRFERVVEPHDPSLLTQIRQNGTHGLFKLHGDIGRETTSMDRLVFTQSQYDAVYREGGELIRELKQWYQNQTLLFLGCSLAMDKTMEVLRDVASGDPGIRHFAIVGCRPEQRSELLDRFGELGIDAIFYDDSNHDAVRVILENLLYETDQAAYQQLADELYRFVGPVRRDDVLMYNAGRIKYVGRAKELAALERFCGSPRTNEWWAVTGPGGMGKSRLVYEFTNQKRNEGWQIHWFSRDQHDRLAELRLPAEDTIVVLDDVQADIQTVGSWLKSMRQHRRRNRLRILLLERDGRDYATADWLRLLRSGSPYTDPLAQWCHDPQFLRLTPLESDDLKAIMADCGKALGKPVDADALLTALIRVDEKLRRPLYALAVAEAACSGEDPIHWDPERVLDELLDRELAFHYESLQYIIRDTPTASQQQELEDLMARCCIRGHLRIEEITDAQYPYLTACMERMSPGEFFRCLGLLQIEDGQEILRMNCPDLIREHLVLRLALDQGRMKLLLPEMWQEDSQQLLFLNHLLNNHKKRLCGLTRLWEPVLAAEPEDPVARAEYAGLLWNLTACDDLLRLSAADRLERLHQKHPNARRIRVACANGLYNLTVDQDLEGRIVAVQRLTGLAAQFPEDREIAFVLAQGLVNLTVKQDLEGRIATVQRLTDLAAQFPDDRVLAFRLAKGLYNLTVDQDLDGCIVTIQKIAALAAQFPGDRAIAFALAQGLYNLTVKQDLEGRIVAVQRLTDLAAQFPEDREIAFALAKGLYNLTVDQDLEGRIVTVQRLTDLAAQFPEDREIALELAKGLVNLSVNQDLDGCIVIVQRIADLTAQFPEGREIAFELAKGFFNLSILQPEADAAATVQRILEILTAQPDRISKYKSLMQKDLETYPHLVSRWQALLEL